MNSPDLGDAFGIIRAAIEYLRGRKDNAKVVVMLDGLDFLLAASIDGCTAEHVHDHIYGIRGVRREAHQGNGYMLADDPLALDGRRIVRDLVGR